MSQLISLVARVHTAFGPPTIEKRKDAIKFGILVAAKIAYAFTTTWTHLWALSFVQCSSLTLNSSLRSSYLPSHISKSLCKLSLLEIVLGPKNSQRSTVCPVSGTHIRVCLPIDNSVSRSLNANQVHIRGSRRPKHRCHLYTSSQQPAFRTGNPCHPGWQTYLA